MSADTQYRPLPGVAGLFTRHRLWLASDHILLVRRAMFWEEYRRFYFSDIQAIVFAEIGNAPAVYGYGAAAAFVVSAMVLALRGHPFWAVLFVISALPVLAFAYSRPSCNCYLKTQVSMERLHALKRLRNARDVSAMLRQNIEAVQGSYQGAETTAIGAPPARPPALVRHCDARLHTVLFASMIAACALVPLQIRWRSDALDAFTSAVSLVLVILGIAAAVRQHGSDLAAPLRSIVLGALVAWGVEFAIAYGIALSAGANGIARPAQMQPWRNWFLRLEEAGAVLDILLGAAGLLLLSRSRQTAAG